MIFSQPTIFFSHYPPIPSVSCKRKKANGIKYWRRKKVQKLLRLTVKFVSLKLLLAANQKCWRWVELIKRRFCEGRASPNKHGYMDTFLTSTVLWSTKCEIQILCSDIRNVSGPIHLNCIRCESYFREIWNIYKKWFCLIYFFRSIYFYTY